MPLTPTCPILEDSRIGDYVEIRGHYYEVMEKNNHSAFLRDIDRNFTTWTPLSVKANRI